MSAEKVTLTAAEREALCICAEVASVNLNAEDEYVQRVCDTHVAAVEQVVSDRLAPLLEVLPDLVASGALRPNAARAALGATMPCTCAVLGQSVSANLCRVHAVYADRPYYRDERRP